MRNEWKLYFLFSEKEQKGMIALGCILFFSTFISFLLPKKQGETEMAASHSIENFKLVPFDPNTIDSMGAIRLGIPPKQVRTLLNYRKKGGRFYKKEQLGKLYGLSSVIVEKLIPYVRITEQASKQIYSNNYMKYATKNKDPNFWKIDINEASEKEWIQKTNLAQPIVHRILRYKNYVGAFENVYQLKKVYGITEQDFQLLRRHLSVGKNTARKFVANTMNFEKWESLGMFTHKEIALILKARKANGGRIGWKEIVILCDLTESQAIDLKSKIYIID